MPDSFFCSMGNIPRNRSNINPNDFLLHAAFVLSSPFSLFIPKHVLPLGHHMGWSKVLHRYGRFLERWVAETP